MDKRDTPFVGGLVILVILAIIGTFALSSAGKKAVENSNRQPPQAANELPPPPPEPPVNESAKYFEWKLSDIGAEYVGHPIEGLNPELLIMSFPGLTRADFHGVATIAGRYELQGEDLVFVRGQGNSESSVDQMVSSEGYGTLLTNVSVRLGMSADTQADIDAIIVKIDTSQRVTVQIGEAGSAFGVTVVPLKLLEDSRCPIDVTCIWAGTVRVQASVNGGSGVNKQAFTLDKPVTTASVTVTLERVVPEPRSGVKIDSADYIFVFKIDKR